MIQQEHVTEPGYEAAEHCPECGSFAARRESDEAGLGIEWQCQRSDCGHVFREAPHPSIDSPQSPTFVAASTDTGGPPTCDHCGTAVSRDYVRVFGDDDGRLPHCWNCASRTQRYSNDPVIDPE